MVDTPVQEEQEQARRAARPQRVGVDHARSHPLTPFRVAGLYRDVSPVPLILHQVAILL